MKRRPKKKQKPTGPPPALILPGPHDAPRFFGYSRVSTKDQADHGSSLARQKADLKKVWQLRYEETHSFAGVFEDGAVSGATHWAERPEGKRLDLSLRKGDVIAFASVDRAFRRLADGVEVLGRLDKAGVQVIILNLISGDQGGLPVNFSTAMGRMFVQILLVFAELERSLIAERCQAGQRARRLVNDWLQSPPYGMKRRKAGSKYFEIDHRHREYVRKVMALAAELNISLSNPKFRYALKDRGILWYKRRTDEGAKGLWANDSQPPTVTPSLGTIRHWIAKEKQTQAKEAAGFYRHKQGTWRKKKELEPVEAAAGVVLLESVPGEDDA